MLDEEGIRTEIKNLVSLFLPTDLQILWKTADFYL
jgi:hypothetical protein